MEILSNFCGLLRKRQLRQLKRLFSGLFDLNTLIIEFASHFQWWEDNQKKIRIRKFWIRIGSRWTWKNYIFSSLILFLHLIQHWIWAPSSTIFTLLIFFYSDSFFFSKHTNATRNSCDVAINFFLSLRSVIQVCALEW